MKLHAAARGGKLVNGKLFMETSYGSLIKKEQELCGDKVEIEKSDEETILVLADGLGSGVKANILASLTSKIIMTMLKGGATIEEVVDTIVATLPVCKERRVAYCTFTILRIKADGSAQLVEYDNPDTIFLRNGKEVNIPKEILTFHGKEIKEANFQMKPDDVCIIMSDGVVCAGPNQLLRFAWKRENIVAFAQKHYKKEASAFSVQRRILTECNSLYIGEVGDDSTVAVCKVRHEGLIHLMIGPPVDPSDDELVVKKFMNTYGKKIVCGGTTSKIVSKVLGKELKLLKCQSSIDVPPMASIEDIDLVTEGVITLGKSIEIIRNLDQMEMKEISNMRYSENGAKRLVWTLMEGGTHVVIFMGRAVNEAHLENQEIDFGLKSRLVEELSEELKKRDKVVEIQYA